MTDIASEFVGIVVSSATSHMASYLTLFDQVGPIGAVVASIYDGNIGTGWPISGTTRRHIGSIDLRDSLLNPVPCIILVASNGEAPSTMLTTSSPN